MSFDIGFDDDNSAPQGEEEARRFYNQNWPLLADYLESVLSSDKSKAQPMLNTLTNQEVYGITFEICMKLKMASHLERDIGTTINYLIRKQANVLFQIHESSEWLRQFMNFVIQDRSSAITIRNVFAYFDGVRQRADTDLEQDILEAIYNHLVFPFERQLFQVLGSLTVSTLPEDHRPLVHFFDNLFDINSDCIAYNPDIFFTLLPNTPPPANILDLRAKNGRVLGKLLMDNARHDFWINGYDEEGKKDSKRSLEEDMDDAMDEGEEEYVPKNGAKRTALDTVELRN